MTEDTLQLRGLEMARHPYDILPPNPQYLAAIDSIADAQFNTVTPLYKPNNPRWEEMDRYWAGEYAAFLKLSSQQYSEFLPGKFFTYKTLADKVEDHMTKDGKSLKNVKTAEIGCGSATWSLLLAQKGAQVYLFDKSWCALEYAKYLAGKTHFNVQIPLDNIQQGDFYKLPQEWKDSGGKFDAVVAGGVLEHLSIEDQNRYLQEVWTILKPGGLIAFSMPNKASPLNISADERKNFFYELIKKIGNCVYTIVFPMSYHKSGGTRNMEEMLVDNSFEVKEDHDAVLLAPSGDLGRKLITGDLVANCFYGRLEKMCEGGLIDTNQKDNKKRVQMLIEFWTMASDSLRKEERRRIGRWLYAVGRKKSA